VPGQAQGIAWGTIEVIKKGGLFFAYKNGLGMILDFQLKNIPAHALGIGHLQTNEFNPTAIAIAPFYSKPPIKKF